MHIRSFVNPLASWTSGRPRPPIRLVDKVHPAVYRSFLNQRKSTSFTELDHSPGALTAFQMTPSHPDSSALFRALAAGVALAVLPLAAAGSASDAAVPPATGPAPAGELGALRSSDPAGSRSLITFRRTLGLAFLAGGAALAAKGFDYKDEADAFYESYQAADDAAEIQKLYQRTTNRDVKSQVSWALAAACGVTGLRLLFTGGGEVRAALPGSPSLSVVPAPAPGGLGLRLQRRFH